MPNISQFTNFLRGAQSFLGGSGDASGIGEATKVVQLRRLLQEPSPREEFALSKRRQGVSEANLALRAGEHQLNQVRVLFSGLESGLQNASSQTEVEHFYLKAGAIRKTLSPVMQQLYDIKFPGGRFGPIGRREQVFDSMFPTPSVTTSAEEDPNLFGTQSLRLQAHSVRRNNYKFQANIPEPKSFSFTKDGLYHTTYTDTDGMTKTLAISDEEFERLGVKKGNPWKFQSGWSFNDGDTITRFETYENLITNQIENRSILREKITRSPTARRDVPAGEQAKRSSVYAAVLFNFTQGKAKVGGRDIDSRTALVSKSLIKLTSKGKLAEAQSLLRAQFPEEVSWVNKISEGTNMRDYRDFVLDDDNDYFIVSTPGSKRIIIASDGLAYEVIYDPNTGDMFDVKDGAYLGNTETTGARLSQ